MTSLVYENHHVQNLDNSQTSNLTFIDTNLTNYQSLIPDTNDNVVILIDSGKNGIEQITEALEQYSNLDSISIFSHGDVGSIQLGNTYLSDSNLDNYQNDLAAWGNVLSETGDLLFYGCNLGANQAGMEFVDRVAHLTGADVAASNDLTGNATLGGDWTLEVATGEIETKTFALTEYGSLLDLKFNFTYDSNVNTAQKTAFEYAGRAWSNILADNVTINLHVSMANNHDLPSNTLGGAVPFFHQGTSFNSFKNKLQSDIKSNDDNVGFNSLNKSHSGNVPSGYYETWFLEQGGIHPQHLNKVAMTRANAKALGLINSNDSTLDGTIVMNNLVGTGVNWQYNYLSNSVGSNEIDFTTVAMHEIGHTLGFVSLVDGLTNENYHNTTLRNDSATALDLFRQSTLHGYGNYNNSFIRFIATLNSGFSITGNGNSILAEMSYGSSNVGVAKGGDGYQGSHWKNEENAGIMDPLLELGVRRGISNLDLRALDVIGWDRKSASASNSTLWSQAQNEAMATGNVNRNVEIDGMLTDWRWARRGSESRLRQDGNIAQFLAQEGFFSVGAFRESFDFSTVTSVEENNFTVVVNNQLKPQEFPSNDNNDSDSTSSSEIISDTSIADVVVENEGISYEQMLALVTEGLSDYELSQLSLDDLAKLIEQQLAESLVPSLS